MKKLNKKTIITSLLILLVVIGGILVIKKAKAKSDNAPIAKEFPIMVRTTKIASDGNQLTLPYLAVVQNDQDVTITSKISSRILFLKPSGTPVKAGEVVARLDNSSFQTTSQSVQSQLAAQKIALENQKLNHSRTLQLLAVKGASKEQSENEISKIAEIESKIDALQQSKNDISNSFSYTTIVTPSSGVVAKTMLNVGDVAMPGQPIALISSNNGSFLKLSVPSDLKIKGISLKEQFYKAIPLNNTFNGLAEYKVYAENMDLLTGERVPVDIVLYEGQGLKVPYDAVLNRSGKSFVFVIENNKAVPKEITITESGENALMISNEELSGKEIVIAKQDILLSLLSGSVIKIIQKNKE